VPAADKQPVGIVVGIEFRALPRNQKRTVASHCDPGSKLIALGCRVDYPWILEWIAIATVPSKYDLAPFRVGWEKIGPNVDTTTKSVYGNVWESVVARKVKSLRPVDPHLRSDVVRK
jgi:hypothetical protein